MVQRKVSNKFGIESEPVKAERRVVSFKPTSAQNQDAKNRGADLKKKMKKSSRPIKLSDLGKESLTSTPIGKNIAQPGKPPPFNGSPNYMKSTSCFDARKEVSQVSARNIQLSNDNKNTRKGLESSVHGSVSGRKPTKCLTKSSSFKLVRTLTKTPSFKPARGSLKKSSRVALCEDINAQRATCSSTLKDSKFPAFLMLSPGATESEGTSAMKVCPYTYCSLNGHRHAPLPSLKCFLSARRLLLKTQKNLKLGALSPRKVKPSDLSLEKTEAGMDGKLASEDLGNSESSPLIDDSSSDFFIEIYAENKEDGAESVGEEGMVNEDGSFLTSFNGDDETEANKEKIKQFAEIVSDGSPEFVVDSGEGNFFCGNDFEDDASSTDAEMEEWEEQQFFSMEADDLDELEDQSNYKIEGLSEKIQGHDGKLFESGDMIKDCEGVFFTDEMEKEICAKSGDFEEQFYVEESEFSRHQVWDVEESSQVSQSLNYDQLSYTEDAFDDIDTSQGTIEKAVIEYVAIVVSAVPSTEESILNSELKSELADTHCVPQEIEEASSNDQENQDFQVDGTDTLADNGVCNSHLDVEDGDRVETNEDCSWIQKDVFLFDHQRDLDFVLREEIINGEEQCLLSERDETEFSAALEAADTEELIDLKTDETILDENGVAQIDIADEKDTAGLTIKAKNSSRGATNNSSEELPDLSKNLQHAKGKKLGDETEDSRDFNPREPNYLPLVPDPESEKVDLKHQLMDDRKNAEEWMLDYALQQTVTKLAPARKKKVALLVEAFESVLPASKCEIRLRNPSGIFTQAKPIQACF